MDEAEYLARIETIRARFSARLIEEIKATVAKADHLTGTDEEIVGEVADLYRQFHGVCGIGATIGYGATAEAAGALDVILVVPFRDQRGLNDDETAKLKQALKKLWIIATAEGSAQTGKVAAL